MYDIQKWNFKTQRYDPYQVPDGTVLALYLEDMDTIIHCAGCFQPLQYGKSLTSRTLHNQMGFGWPVCADCYAIEFKNEREAKAHESE